MFKSKIQTHREFLKDNVRLDIDFRKTDQSVGKAPPTVQKLPKEDQELISLPEPETFDEFKGTDLIDAIGQRRSHRDFKEIPLSKAELAFLLWSTQGISAELAPGVALRTVPSAGCRHAFETYCVVQGVTGLDVGVYRYLPLEHALVFEHAVENQPAELAVATLGQRFVATAPVTFVWTVIPYRMEWRYEAAAHRVIAMDVGHVCQNLYLACESIGCGTCAIAAYHQEKMDKFLKVDGDDEFTLYLAPVGKV